mmetsp:Transcript_12538/g.35761  ORF Transcript_12538/g.35761 Transcript_12538/m.35761 type:complete len:217 (-) Transcript_12538:573-1223(-)
MGRRVGDAAGRGNFSSRRSAATASQPSCRAVFCWPYFLHQRWKALQRRTMRAEAVMPSTDSGGKYSPAKESVSCFISALACLPPARAALSGASAGSAAQRLRWMSWPTFSTSESCSMLSTPPSVSNLATPSRTASSSGIGKSPGRCSARMVSSGRPACCAASGPPAASSSAAPPPPALRSSASRGRRRLRARESARTTSRSMQSSFASALSTSSHA